MAAEEMGIQVGKSVSQAHGGLHIQHGRDPGRDNRDGGLDAVDARQLLKALKDLRRGDFSVRLPIASTPLGTEIADAFNDVVELNDIMCKELARIALVVGKQCMISQRSRMGNVTGDWA